MTTQCNRVLEYMRQFGSISTIQAFTDLGVARLASRIHDLKRMGYVIKSETRSGVNRFGENTRFTVYSLAENN